MLQLFLEEVPRRVERLQGAWRAGNAEELQRAAHSLKGSAGNIGARQLYDDLPQLDERGKAGDFNGARHLMDSLDEEYAEVEAEIRRLLG